jgi:hypothetical protein
VIFGAVTYTFLGLFNPRMHLTVTPSAVPLGETLRIEWELNGRIEVLQNLTLRLEGREEATYRRGTDNCTDTNVFARIEIANVTANQGMRSGNGTITIPADSMHSFTSTHNKIIWTIRAEGEIPRWPDLSEEFALTVLPSRLRRQQDI